MPNVRKARDSAEVAALGLRHASARDLADEAGFVATFDAYEAAVADSGAVICMTPTRLLPVACEGALVSTFMLQVEGQMRVAQDNEFDGVRTSFEEAYFPGYSNQVRFGALSLDGSGHAAYGSCAVSLKTSAIEGRASVFEFPLYQFSQTLNLAKPIPAGHRCDWESRGRLAVTKAGAKLDGLRHDDFQRLLLPPPTTTISECIEVHVYGPLNIHSLKSVAFYRSVREEDLIIQDLISSRLDEQSIAVRHLP